MVLGVSRAGRSLGSDISGMKTSSEWLAINSPVFSFEVAVLFQSPHNDLWVVPVTSGDLLMPVLNPPTMLFSRAPSHSPNSGHLHLRFCLPPDIQMTDSLKSFSLCTRNSFSARPVQVTIFHNVLPAPYYLPLFWIFSTALIPIWLYIYCNKPRVSLLDCNLTIGR